MNEEQKSHLSKIVTVTTERIRVKYERGQREHKDNLWERPVFRDVIDECTDLNTYLVTLECQLRSMHNTLTLARKAELDGMYTESERLLDKLDTAFRSQLSDSSPGTACSQ